MSRTAQKREGQTEANEAVAQQLATLLESLGLTLQAKKSRRQRSCARIVEELYLAVLPGEGLYGKGKSKHLMADIFLSAWEEPSTARLMWLRAALQGIRKASPVTGGFSLLELQDRVTENNFLHLFLSSPHPGFRSALMEEIRLALRQPKAARDFCQQLATPNSQKKIPLDYLYVEKGLETFWDLLDLLNGEEDDYSDFVKAATATGIAASALLGALNFPADPVTGRSGIQLYLESLEDGASENCETKPRGASQPVRKAKAIWRALTIQGARERAFFEKLKKKEDQLAVLARANWESALSALSRGARKELLLPNTWFRECLPNLNEVGPEALLQLMKSAAEESTLKLAPEGVVTLEATVFATKLERCEFWKVVLEDQEEGGNLLHSLLGRDESDALLEALLNALSEAIIYFKKRLSGQRATPNTAIASSFDKMVRKMVGRKNDAGQTAFQYALKRRKIFPAMSCLTLTAGNSEAFLDLLGEECRGWLGFLVEDCKGKEETLEAFRGVKARATATGERNLFVRCLQKFRPRDSKSLLHIAAGLPDAATSNALVQALFEEELGPRVLKSRDRFGNTFLECINKDNMIGLKSALEYLENHQLLLDILTSCDSPSLLWKWVCSRQREKVETLLEFLTSSTARQEAFTAILELKESASQRTVLHFAAEDDSIFLQLVQKAFSTGASSRRKALCLRDGDKLNFLLSLVDSGDERDDLVREVLKLLKSSEHWDSLILDAPAKRENLLKRLVKSGCKSSLEYLLDPANESSEVIRELLSCGQGWWSLGCKDLFEVVDRNAAAVLELLLRAYKRKGIYDAHHACCEVAPQCTLLLRRFLSRNIEETTFQKLIDAMKKHLEIDCQKRVFRAPFEWEGNILHSVARCGPYNWEGNILHSVACRGPFKWEGNILHSVAWNTRDPVPFRLLLDWAYEINLLRDMLLQYGGKFTPLLLASREGQTRQVEQILNYLKDKNLTGLPKSVIDLNTWEFFYWIRCEPVEDVLRDQGLYHSSCRDAILWARKLR